MAKTNAAEVAPTEEEGGGTVVSDEAAPKTETKSEGRGFFSGKYTHADEKIPEGAKLVDFKYSTTMLYPGFEPKGYKRSLQPVKEGEKKPREGVFCRIYKIILEHWNSTGGQGMTGNELLAAMVDADWTGIQSQYAETGRVSPNWAKDYIIGATRPNSNQCVVLEKGIKGTASFAPPASTSANDVDHSDPPSE